MRFIKIRFVILAGLIFAGQITAQKTPPELPHFDIRHEKSTVDFGAKTALRQQQASLSAYAGAALGSGADRVKIRFNSFGWPKVVFNPGGVLVGTGGQDPLAAAKAFLATYFPLVPLQDHEREQLRLVRRQSWNGLSQVTLQQVAGGLPVWGGLVTVTVNSNFEVFHLMVGEIAPGAAVDPTPELSETQAIRTAASAAGLEPPEELVRQLGASANASWTYFRHPLPGRTPVIIQLTAFPMDASSLRPAYRTFIDGANHDSYEILIDANTGALLYRQDVVDRMGQARVWRQSPIHGDRELVTFPDGWLPEDGTVTTGNNVDAFLDRDVNAQPDADEIENIENGRAVSEDQVFDFPADELGRNPFDFAAAAVTSTFFNANEAHDYFYSLGFTEEAGNFQMDNFDRGGIGGDPVLVGTQTFFFTRFSRRPEGVSPLIGMGLSAGPNRDDPSDDRDLAYDAQAMIHEYGHGVTSRIIGGPDDVACSFADQSRALSEGWSDYFAAGYVDDPVILAYSRDNLESGIRRHSLEGTHSPTKISSTRALRSTITEKSGPRLSGTFGRSWGKRQRIVWW